LRSSRSEGSSPRRVLARRQSLSRFGFETPSLRIILRQIVCELIAVPQLSLQPIQLTLQPFNNASVSRIKVEVLDLMRIAFQIEQLPLIELVEVNQLITVGANSVVRRHVVIARMIVTVIHRRSPILYPLAFKQRQEAAALHI